MTTATTTDATITRCARECAEDASRQGARGPLAADEDAFPADYEYLTEELGRAATSEDKAAFRDAYSAALRRPESMRGPDDDCGMRARRQLARPPGVSAAKRKPGRPPGVTPTVPRVIRLSPEQDERLVRLAEESGEAIVDIVRRAVAQLLVRET